MNKEKIDFKWLKREIWFAIQSHVNYFIVFVDLLAVRIHSSIPKPRPEEGPYECWYDPLDILNGTIPIKFNELTGRIAGFFEQYQEKDLTSEDTNGKSNLEKDLFLFKRQVFNVLNENYRILSEARNLENQIYSAFDDFEEANGVKINLEDLSQEEPPQSAAQE